MAICSKHVLAACAGGIIGVGSVAAQPTWTGATNDDWLTGSNWDTLNPPGMNEFARIPSGSTPDFNGFTSILALEIAAGASVEISSNSNMGLTGFGVASTINNGLIKLNEDNSSFNSIITFPNAHILGGSGVLEMLTANDNSQLVQSGSGSLTNGPSHTIRGAGQINVGFVNQGVIDGSLGNPGQFTLEIRTAGENQGTMSATAIGGNNGILEFAGVPLVQTGAGRLLADGGQVQFESGTSITGGTIETINGGFAVTTSGTTGFAGVTNNGELFLNQGTTIAVTGSGFQNNGVTSLNPQNGGFNAIVRFDESGTLNGSGELRLLTGNDNSQLDTAAGQTINHGGAHTVRGVGEIKAAINNAGTVAADTSIALSGTDLALQVNDKSNTGLLEARTDSLLSIESITIDQTGGGDIEANGGTVNFFGPSVVIGGDVSTSAGGAIGIKSGAVTTFDGVDLEGDLFVEFNGTLDIASELTNNARISMNDQNSGFNSIITTDEPVTIDGTGEIVMRTSGDNTQLNTTGSGQITQGADHFISGVGQINADLVNDGIISADVGVALSGTALELDIGPYVNNNRMTAEDMSTLQIEDVLITQAPLARIEAADGGIVTLGLNSRIQGGELRTGFGGVIRTIGGGTRELSDVRVSANLDIDFNTVLAVDSGGIVNDGLIRINPSNSSFDGVLLLDDATVSGFGDIQLLTGGLNSFIRTAPGSTGTIGELQLVRGFGVIDGAITNDGTIAADRATAISGTELLLNTNDKVNNNSLRANADSTLATRDITIDQTGGGRINAFLGGLVDIRLGSTIIGGSISSDADSFWQVSGGRSDFDGVTLEGRGNILFNSTLAVQSDTLNNTGRLTVNSSNSSFDGVLLVTQDTTFTGGGEIDFFTSGIGNSRLSPEAGLDPLPVVTNAAGHTLSGFATTQVPVVNEGTIAIARPFAGTPSGDFTVQQPLTLAPSSQLDVAIGFSGFNGQLDPVGADGIVNLGGTLNVSVADGNALTNNFNHIIVDGPYTGTFDTENTAVEGQLITRVRYETNQVVLRTRCLADTNLDGSVDPGDFNAWVLAFNGGDSVADQNLDGLNSPADFNAWILNFNTPCP